MKNEQINININNFINYNTKTLAQFYAAIRNIEEEKTKCIKNCDFISAWKLFKLQTKLEILLSKKTFHDELTEIKNSKKQ